jgi:hypothetical protein
VRVITLHFWCTSLGFSGCLLLLRLQYKGTLQLDDFASHSEPDEYIFTVTADAIGEVDKRVSTCTAAALQ